MSPRPIHPTPRLWWLAWMGLGLIHPGSAVAQSTFVGQVVDTTGAPMAGVGVIVEGTALRSTTRTNGRFQIDSVPAGRHRILFRQIGFRAEAVWLQFTTHDTTTVSVVLGQDPFVLPEVTTTGERRETRTPKMARFEGRRDAGTGGHFIGDEILREREHSLLSDVLRRIPGVQLVLIPGGGRAARSSRSSISLQTQCFMRVFVDGIRVWDPGSRARLGTTNLYNIDNHPVQQLQGIEVYSGSASTPADLGGGTSECGTIVLWTRDR